MHNVDVAYSGAVLLGQKVTCDGFDIDRPIRIQSHWHADHMAGFGSSKRGELVMSRGTFDLLKDRHPDFEFRANIHIPAPGEDCEVQGTRIRLEGSSHCLGAVQAAVELSNGKWVGYSGDFSYPLENVINVDELVVDATYGDPLRDRPYTQLDAEEALVEIVRKVLSQGPVHIMAHGGVAERALAVLHAEEVIHDHPVVAGKRMCHAIDVYRKSNYPLPEAHYVDSPEGLRIRQNGSYIRCWGPGQSTANDALPGTIFRLTKFAADEVIKQESDRLYRVGFSNHAGFAGTMEYISRTGAQFVLTDGSRSSGAKARALAAAVVRELGVKAKAAVPEPTLQYGK